MPSFTDEQDNSSLTESAGRDQLLLSYSDSEADVSLHEHITRRQSLASAPSVSSLDESSLGYVGDDARTGASSPGVDVPAQQDSCAHKREHVDEDVGRPLRTEIGLRKRFGHWKVVTTLSISTVLLLVTTALISFLWFGDSNSTTWRQITIENWMTRTVALAALVIRTCVSLQAGVATSMVAAMIMEGCGIRLLDIVELTAARFTNSQPHSLLLLYSLDWKLRIYAILLVLLSLSTLAVQFTSTLLLSDINPTGIPGQSANESIWYGLRGTGGDVFYSIGAGELQQYETQAPSGFQTFAEYREPVDAVDGADDTGLTIRSFPPIANQTKREKLKDYQGPAFVYDARVACVQPEFKSLQFCGYYKENRVSRICGEFSPRVKVPGLVSQSTNVRFNCSSHMAVAVCNNGTGTTTCPTSGWNLCGLDSRAGGLISSLDPTNNSSLTHREINIKARTGSAHWSAGNDHVFWPVDLGGSYLLIHFDGNPALLGDDISRAPTKYTSNYGGVWANVSMTFLENGTSPHAKTQDFSGTVCYDSVPRENVIPHLQDLNVVMSSKSTRQEPTTRWVPELAKFETELLRRQLGGSKQHTTAGQRGILELSRDSVLAEVEKYKAQWQIPDDLVLPTSNGTKVNASYLANFRDTTKPDQLAWSFVPNNALPKNNTEFEIVYCRSCFDKDLLGGIMGNNRPQVSPHHSSLFLDILESTGSPSLAIQAQLTTLFRMAYYTWLPMFDANTTASVAVFETSLAPVSRSGYWAVIGILASHIVIFLAISGLFVKTTGYTMLGNSWHIFAQIMNSDTVRDIAVDAELKTDKEMETLIKGVGKGKARYRLTRAENSESVELVSAIE